MKAPDYQTLESFDAGGFRKVIDGMDITSQEDERLRAVSLVLLSDAQSVEVLRQADAGFHYFGEGEEDPLGVMLYKVGSTQIIVTGDGVSHELSTLLDESTFRDELREASLIVAQALEDADDDKHREAWFRLRILSCATYGARQDWRDAVWQLVSHVDWSDERELQLIRSIRSARSADVLADAGIDLERIARLAGEETSSAAIRRPHEVGVIYTITMPDQQCYIGKTVRDAEQRWSEHRRAAETGEELPIYRALRYWSAQGRVGDVRWCVEERVLGWSDDDLASAERRWIGGMGTLNVMEAARAATLYPDL